MKAVLMTDVFQSILMFAAVFSVIIYAVIDKGSFANIWEIAQLGNRTELLKWIFFSFQEEYIFYFYFHLVSIRIPPKDTRGFRWS